MIDPNYKAIRKDDDLTHSYLSTNKSIDIECFVRMESPTNSTACRCSKNIPAWKEVCMDTLSFCLTLPFLAALTLVALLNTAKRHFDLKQPTTSHQQRLQENQADEDITQDETYYAQRWGYNCQSHKTITEDGHILQMYRFGPKGNAERTGESRKPVLLGHGLFQCSGDFVLNEKDSIVFALVDEGYDVWTGNNRAVGPLEHVSLSPDDPCYWDWGLKELGIYDLPAMLDYICTTTGQEKVGYIGHSQGNALAFVGLSLRPELADKMSCFIALAPAVISGALTHTFPLRYLIHMDRKMFKLLFGKKAFLGLMTTAQRILPPSVMCTLAYSVFAYLFAWWDHHWVRRRKLKYFQFTPRLVSTRLLLDWLDGWGRQGICLHVNTTAADNKQTNRIPLAVIYGANDYLVDGASFVRSFAGYENHGVMEDEWQGLSSATKRPSLSFPTLDLVHVERIQGYEHMDTIWAHDNTVTSYPVIFNVLKEATWTPYNG
ncbi:Alpha/Beta hydrolase protein [Chlamydoabsidia padenii]|nr:Alpha/Beta hydrolase protein [Chlamydoabsidia padenii]